MTGGPATAEECFDTMHPACRQVTLLVRAAPLPADERAGLALLVAAYFVGIAGAAMEDGGKPGGTARVLDMIRAADDLEPRPAQSH